MVAPRKRGSVWSAVNKARIERLVAEGRMQPAGQAVIDAAIADGSWTILDPVEDLAEPDDLSAALDADPTARLAWDAFPPSARKAMLWWVISAIRQDARERRIDTIVAKAVKGERAQG